MNNKISIIAATFHQEIADEMIQVATESIEEHKSEHIETIKVKGSYEIPLIAQATLKQKKCDGIVVLAFIEKGETLHGEVMGHVVHHSLVDLQLKHEIPIGIGIIGPGATVEQAKVRASSAAQSAVSAVIDQITILQKN